MFALVRFAIAFLALSFLVITANAAPRELRIASEFPEGSHIHEDLVYFKGMVETATNGQIKITILPPGEFFENHSVQKAIGAGAVEMAVAALMEYGNTIPATRVFSQPFMFHKESLVHVATAPKSPIRVPIDDAIYKKIGARVLWWVAAGASVMLAKGKAVHTPADIKGKKISVPGPVLREMVRYCGGVPVLIPDSKKNAAFKANGADAAMTSISSVVNYKLWEVMDSLTISHHIENEDVVLINEKVWQSLTKEQQAIIQDAARKSEVKDRHAVHVLEEKAIKLAKKNGMKVEEITSADVRAWKICASPMLEKFRRRAGRLGAQVMQGYRKVMIDAYKTPGQKPVR